MVGTVLGAPGSFGMKPVTVELLKSTPRKFPKTGPLCGHVYQMNDARLSFTRKETSRFLFSRRGKPKTKPLPTIAETITTADDYELLTG
jgi:hypothetical protein